MSTIAPGCWRRLFYVDKSAFFCLLKGWSNNFKQYNHIDAQYLSTPHRIPLHTARVGSSPQQQPAASLGFTRAGPVTPFCPWTARDNGHPRTPQLRDDVRP